MIDHIVQTASTLIDTKPILEFVYKPYEVRVSERNNATRPDGQLEAKKKVRSVLAVGSPIGKISWFHVILKLTRMITKTYVPAVSSKTHTHSLLEWFEAYAECSSYHAYWSTSEVHIRDHGWRYTDAAMVLCTISWHGYSSIQLHHSEYIIIIFWYRSIHILSRGLILPWFRQHCVSYSS